MPYERVYEHRKPATRGDVGVDYRPVSLTPKPCGPEERAAARVTVYAHTKTWTPAWRLEMYAMLGLLEES